MENVFTLVFDSCHPLLLPLQINAEPFEGGWLAKIKLSDPSEADSLLDANAYKKHVESQAH